MPRTLAALASIPARAHFLPQALGSLRAQFDLVHVYLNGYKKVPDAVRELADEWVLDPENNGAERKFWWADRRDVVYFTCDDDIVYPADYAQTMLAALDAAGRDHIVTGHGRVYLGKPIAIHDTKPGSVGMFHLRVDNPRPINHGGTGCMAWDASRVHVPSRWQLKNIADMQLAVWAHRHEVPMMLVAHQAHWFKPLLLIDPRGIYKSSQREQHCRRNQLLRDEARRSGGWRLIEEAA